MSDRATPAYACASRAAGSKQCDLWCGDSAKCIASPVLMSARAAIEQRYTGQGAAAPHGASNPYREGSSAATWWQRGHDAAPQASTPPAPKDPAEAFCDGHCSALNGHHADCFRADQPAPAAPEQPRISLMKQDEQYRRALAIALESGRASVSMIQRKLSIGYSAAQQLVVRMVCEGLVDIDDTPGVPASMLCADGVRAAAPSPQGEAQLLGKALAVLEESHDDALKVIDRRHGAAIAALRASSADMGTDGVKEGGNGAT